MAVHAGGEQVRRRAQVWVCVPKRHAQEGGWGHPPVPHRQQPFSHGGQTLSMLSAKSSNKLPLNLLPQVPASPAPCMKLLLYSLVSSLSCCCRFYCIMLPF